MVAFIIFSAHAISRIMILPMAYVFPIAVENSLVGSGVVIEVGPDYALLATALHLLGASSDIRVGLPPHNGNMSCVQAYPIAQFPALNAVLVASNPLADIGILALKTPAQGQIPPFGRKDNIPTVGHKIVALGYPFAPMGSCLETWAPGFVSARTKRMVSANVGIDEFIITNPAHPGSSGSAVVGQEDGILYGILRGSLSPPDILRIGDVPIATDTTVTFVVSIHYAVELLPLARELLKTV